MRLKLTEVLADLVDEPGAFVAVVGLLLLGLGVGLPVGVLKLLDLADTNVVLLAGGVAVADLGVVAEGGEGNGEVDVVDFT